MPVNTILGLFAKSPIKPLQKHIVKVHQCSQQLVPFFDAVAEDRWEVTVHREDVDNNSSGSG